MRTLFSAIGSVFRGLWRCIDWFRRSLANILFLIFLIVVLFAIFGGKHEDAAISGALVVEPVGSLTEQLAGDPRQLALERLQGIPPSETLVQDLTAVINRAASDTNVKMLVLKPGGMTGASIIHLQQLAESVQRFRASGKLVLAYGDVLTQAQYFVAAQADEIVLDPMGLVLIRGFGAFPRYYKAALDKYGITMNVFRVGEHKSAVEPFLRNDMSAEAKQSNKVWLDQLWDGFLTDVAERRGTTAAALQSTIDQFPQLLEQYKGDGAKLALEQGWVTSLETPSQFQARVAESVGKGEDDEGFKRVAYGSYLGASRRTSPLAGGSGPTLGAEVGLIYAVGNIVDGYQPPGTAGGESIAELLEIARTDDNIAAVVLRVDSPGGSVTASERIRREVVRLQASGKPVIASMGSYAASGGYWISMNADRIIASPATLTGSIGIFGLLPNLSPALNERGINVDGVGTTPWASGLRFDDPLSTGMKQGMQSLIENGYDDFISKVAEARELPLQRVDELARGRVWTGADAVKFGLVDEEGDIQSAIVAARQLAKLPENAGIQLIESAESQMLRVLQRFGAKLPKSMAQPMGRTLAVPLAKIYGLPQTPLGWLKGQLPLWVGGDPRGVYAHCFCSID